MFGRFVGRGGEDVYQGAYGLQRGEARDRRHVYVRCDFRLAIGEDEAHTKDARGSRDYPAVQDLAILIEKLRVIETKGIFRG